MINVLLTGGSSLLGWELLRQAPSEWRITVGVHRNPDLPPSSAITRIFSYDISDRASVDRLVEEARPHVVIHMSSHGNLEYCKNHPEEARRVNIEGTRNLLEASTRFQPVFLFTSTMYVFDGSAPPYDEFAAPHPINYYGATKLEAERLVQSMNERAMIFRPMTMYGWHSPKQRANWVTWLLGRLKQHESVPVVSDVISNQIWVGDGAESLIAAVRKEARGIFHLGGSESVSRYDFSVEVARIFGYPADLIVPVTSDYFPQLAQRPGSAVCSVDKMTKILGVKPLNVRQGLERMRTLAPVFEAAVQGLEANPRNFKAADSNC